jgi:MFS family permease
MLVVGRCVQGLSVSVLFAVGLANLVDTVGRDEVGQWTGFVLSGMNIGVMVSPFLGGLVYAKAGYYQVFAMCLGVLILVFLLRISIIEQKAVAKYERVTSPGDEANYGTCTEGHHTESHAPPPLVNSNSEYDFHGCDSPTPDAAEASERDHLVPTSDEDRQHSNRSHVKPSFLARNFPVVTALLRSPRILTVCFACFIHLAVITAFDAVLPIFVQKTFGWGSTGAGVIFLAITIPAIFGAAMGGASDRFGPRIVALCGFAVAIPSIALLGLVNHDSTGQIVLLCVLLSGTGKS